uniref:Uncharacterized protein n=1 Tax=Timema monikensis TaxID=170555 RepID=A0A7R9EHU8_9NEOP|nr:unnamed protein product [Timema monikensis]
MYKHVKLEPNESSDTEEPLLPIECVKVESEWDSEYRVKIEPCKDDEICPKEEPNDIIKEKIHIKEEIHIKDEIIMKDELGGEGEGVNPLLSWTLPMLRGTMCPPPSFSGVDVRGSLTRVGVRYDKLLYRGCTKKLHDCILKGTPLSNPAHDGVAIPVQLWPHPEPRGNAREPPTCIDNEPRNAMSEARRGCAQPTVHGKRGGGMGKPRSAWPLKKVTRCLAQRGGGQARFVIGDAVMTSLGETAGMHMGHND